MVLFKKQFFKSLCLVVVLSVLLLTVGCKDSGSGKKKKRIIRFSHGHQANFSSEIQTAAWIFKNYVNENCDSLNVKIYASSMLGGEREVYEGIQLGGGADCVISGSAILSNFVPKVGIIDLPFMWKDYDHVHRVLDGEVGDALKADLYEQGFKILAWMDSWGYRNIVVSGKDVKGPEDIKSLKIRTIPTPSYIQALKAMGTNATPMSFGEVYSSMQTGVLDGFEHSASVIYSNKFYEVADNIVLTRHLFGPLAFVFSKAQWEKLTDEERKVIQEAAIFARDCQRALAPLREKEAFDALKEKGMKVTEIDTSGFIQNAVKLQDDFARANGAEDLLEMIRKAAD